MARYGALPRGRRGLLVRSYYQRHTASCSKLRSEVWSGRLQYHAGTGGAERSFCRASGGDLCLVTSPSRTPVCWGWRCRQARDWGRRSHMGPSLPLLSASHCLAGVPCRSGSQAPAVGRVYGLGSVYNKYDIWHVTVRSPAAGADCWFGHTTRDTPHLVPNCAVKSGQAACSTTLGDHAGTGGAERFFFARRAATVFVRRCRGTSAPSPGRR